tara:strand:+ start:1033 stop:1314 length:282 start_codon:yes stop_codon:yes gene_type:complete
MPSIQEVPETPQLKRKAYTIKAQKKYYDKVKNDPELKAIRNARLYAARDKLKAKREREALEKKQNNEINENIDNIKQLLKEGKISLDELKALQ